MTDTRCKCGSTDDRHPLDCSVWSWNIKKRAEMPKPAKPEPRLVRVARWLVKEEVPNWLLIVAIGASLHSIYGAVIWLGAKP